MKRSNLCVLTVAVLFCGSLAIPIRAAAQNTDGKGSKAPDITMQKISLDLESSNLYYGLKLLFSQVRCNFTLDESLKNLTVTAHFTDVPFRIALETLLKSTSTPLTYKLENGIYSVFPIVEEQPAIKESSDSSHVVYVDRDEPKVHMIRVYNISDLDIVQAFGGTILNIGLIPGFGRGGTPPGQTQRGQPTGFFEGGENMYATGHDDIIVVSTTVAAKQ